MILLALHFFLPTQFVIFLGVVSRWRIEEEEIQLIGRLYDNIIITITDHDKEVSNNKIGLKAANSDD